MKKKRKKYATGSSGIVRNYIETPDQAIQKDDLAKNIAAYKAATNPAANALQLLGTTGMAIGGQLGGENAQSIGKGLFAGNQLANMFAFGGDVPMQGGVPVEVEGGEVAQLPNNQMMEFQGASHEAGGMDMTLPPGTEIYADRIKIDGVSMSDRKKKRKKKSMSLEKLMEFDPTDAINKSGSKRTEETNAIEEKADQDIQQFVGQLMQQKGLEPEENQMAYGGRVKHFAGNSVVPNINKIGFKPMFTDDVANQFNPVGPSSVQSIAGSFENPQVNLSGNLQLPETGSTKMNPRGFNLLQKAGIGINNAVNKIKDSDLSEVETPELLKNMTTGDLLGNAGTLFSTFAPIMNTMRNRQMDELNPNYYQDYGQEGLSTVDSAKGFADDMRTRQMRDVERGRIGQSDRMRNMSRGINSLRADDLATYQGAMRGNERANAEYANQMQRLLQLQAGMENKRDTKVMGGEEKADIANRMDRDNYNTQLATDLQSIGYGVQEFGKDINKTQRTMDDRDNLAKIFDSKEGQMMFNRMFNKMLEAKQLAQPQTED